MTQGFDLNSFFTKINTGSETGEVCYAEVLIVLIFKKTKEVYIFYLVNQNIGNSMKHSDSASANAADQFWCGSLVSNVNVYEIRIKRLPLR